MVVPRASTQKMLLGQLGLHLAPLVGLHMASNAFILAPGAVDVRKFAKFCRLYCRATSQSPSPFVPSNSLDHPQVVVKKGNKPRQEWTKEEDLQLIQLYVELGPKCTEISRVMNGRSREAIWHRYITALDPALHLEYEPFTPSGSRLKKSWSKAEDDLLKSLVAEHGPQQWQSFVPHFRGRSYNDIRARYTAYLDPSLKIGIWTMEEDKLILELGPTKKWAEIAKHLPGRSDEAVRNRYNVLKAREARVANGYKIRKTPRVWTDEEDVRLLELLAVYGRKWVKIAEHMDWRSGVAVYMRYISNLDPTLKIGEEWTKMEDDLILEHGPSRKWAYIAETYIAGRSGPAVRNRYIALTRD